MKTHKEKNNRKTKSRAWLFVAILAPAIILAVVLGPLFASKTASAQQRMNQSEPQTANGDTTIEFASQKIKVDARTGKLRTPTVEEARAIVETLTKLADRRSDDLKVVRTPSGVDKVDLEGRFQHVLVGKPNPDGTNEVICVTSMEEAAAFLGIDPSKIPAKDK